MIVLLKCVGLGIKQSMYIVYKQTENRDGWPARLKYINR